MAVDQIAKCPHCHYVFNAAEGIDRKNIDETPKDGDYSLCINCGRYSIFASNTHDGLRPLTEAEKIEAFHDSYLRGIWESWRVVTKNRRSKMT